MKLRWLLCLTLSAAALVSCAAGGIATAPNTTFKGAGSWMRRDSSQGPLIYASGTFNAVVVYNFAGQEVGQLDGVGQPGGLCSDNNGDVYVTSTDRGLIYEYQAGGSLPINILDDRYNVPFSCAVDPTTGDVAVTNSAQGGNDVVVFSAGSSGSSVVYTTPNLETYAFCSYDPSGNLYVDGTGAKDSFQLAALDKGSASFEAVPLSGLNNKHHRPAGVEWDGTYIAVGDALSNVIYRLAISGSSASIAQTVKPKEWSRAIVIEFAIVGKKLLFPKNNKLLYYAYPAGGKYKNGFLGDVGYEITVTNSK